VFDQSATRNDVSETNPMSRREADQNPRTTRPEFPSNADELFAGPGPSTAALRAVDWAATPLGEVAAWPIDLVCAARTVVAASAPMALWWGDEFHQLHNDALLSALGDDVPAVGRPAKECWPERWDILGPSARLALAEGAAARLDQCTLPSADSTSVHLAVVLGPLTDGTGVAGVLASATDITAGVAAAQRAEVDNAETVANLQIALTSNRRIGTAIGILMAHRRITDEAAFELLRGASQRTHRKLREIADDVILTGTLPGDS
jgi:ANTAR domain